MAARWCMTWYEIPPEPPLPPVAEPACTPAFMAWQQGSLYDVVGNRFVTESVEANAALPIGLPCQPLATLSIAGWAGGGPPFFYVNHEGTVAAPVVESHNADAQVCHFR